MTTARAGIADRMPALLGRLRLGTGLVLFAYVSLHLLNHVAGLASIAAMEAGAMWIYHLLQFAPVTWTLYGALLVHFLLALHAIYRRRRLWPMPVAEALQLGLGLAIIPLLAGHVIGTRVAGAFFAVFYTHGYVLLQLGELQPLLGLRQAVALLAAWTHGCIGMHFWLRLKPSWPLLRPWLFAAALLLPAFSLAGFASGLRETALRAEAEGWVAKRLGELNAPNAEAAATLGALTDLVLASWAGGIALSLLARQVRALRKRRAGRVRIAYADGRVAEVERGLSILDASQLSGIPHASICGGRGRCSTCRVRLLRGGAEQPEPSPEEAAVLARIGAPPDTRLACQLRPVADIVVAPLLPPNASMREARRRGSGPPQGQEREIAVLFADLRGFSRLAENRLPYDVVFVLNRYFDAMGRAIEAAGGHVDKFIGDGVMALFGVGGDARDGARRALDAARRMDRALAELNETLSGEIGQKLRIGIGIHAGPAIVGEMGYGRTTGLTAIGDTVNVASRIEALCKPYGAELVVSDSAAEAAGLGREGCRLESTAIRGRASTIDVLVFQRVADLPARD
jgi:adenylate cyclase